MVYVTYQLWKPTFFRLPLPVIQFSGLYDNVSPKFIVSKRKDSCFGWSGRYMTKSLTWAQSCIPVSTFPITYYLITSSFFNPGMTLQDKVQQSAARSSHSPFPWCPFLPSFVLSLFLFSAFFTFSYTHTHKKIECFSHVVIQPVYLSTTHFFGCSHFHRSNAVKVIRVVLKTVTKPRINHFT